MSSMYKVKVFLSDGNMDVFSSETSFSADYGMVTWQLDDYHTITYLVASIFKIEETDVSSNE